MAVAFVQGKAAEAASALSDSVAFTSNVTSGNLIVVGVYAFGETTTSITVTDTLLNTYTKVLTSWQADSGGSDFLNLYYAVSASGGANTVKAQGPSSTGFWGVAISEFSGVGASPTLGVHNGSAAASATTYNGPSFTPAAGSLLCALYGDEANGETLSAGTGWSAAGISATGNNNCALIYVLSAAGTATNGVWTVGGSGTNAGSVYMALTPSGAATDPFPAYNAQNQQFRNPIFRM